MKLASLLLALLFVKTAYGLTLPTPCRTSTDIIFVLDSSGSIADNDQMEKWHSMRRFLSLVITNLGATIERRSPSSSSSGLRFALVQFAETANLTFGFNAHTDHSNVANAVLEAHNYGGTTSLAAGLLEAEGLLPLQDGSRNVVIVVVSDFRPNIGRRNELTIAERLKARSDVKIVSVGVGNIINEMLMRQISSDNQAIISEDHQQLINHISPLIMFMCDGTNNPGGSARQCARDIILCLDTSVSIAAWNTLKEFAALVAANLAMTEKDTKIGVVTFSDSGTVISNLVYFSQNLTNTITGAPHRPGMTNLAGGLTASNQILSDPLRKRFVIIFTDGIVTRNIGQESRIAESMRQAGVIIIAYGVGSTIDRGTLESLVAVNQRNSHVIINPNYATNTTSDVNSVTSLTACPASSPLCDEADIIFAMDRSASIEFSGQGNFNRLKRFVTDLARSIHQRYDKVRFGLVAFSGQAEIISQLNQYNNIDEFVRIIQNVEYTGSHTNLADAIRKAYTALGQAKQNGQILLITDGEPTREVGQEKYEAEDARRHGVTMSAVAVTKNFQNYEELLRDMTENRVFPSPNFESLQNDVVSARKVACEEGPKPGPGGCPGLPEIIFVQDVSASIMEEDLRRAKEFILSAIDTFRRGNSQSRFALVVFGTRGTTIFGLQGDMQDIRNKVNSISVDPMASTNMAGGLERAQEVLSRSRNNSNRVVILVTDGLANVRSGEELGIATRIKNSGASIITVGVTLYGPDYEILQLIASSSSSMIRALNFAMLRSRIAEITQIACPSEVDLFPLTPQPLTPQPIRPRPYTPGPRPIPRQVPESPTGLPSLQCPRSHIVFVIDESRRLHRSQSEFDQTKNLAVSILRHISSTKRDTKFAIVTFHQVGMVKANYATAWSTDDLINIIQGLRLGSSQDSDHSNLGYGLFKGRTVLSQSIDTRMVESHIILFSDGVADPDSGLQFYEARMARNQGIQIMAVALSSSPATNVLIRLTGDSSLVFNAPNNQLDGQVFDHNIDSCGAVYGRQPVMYSRQDRHCPKEIVFVIDVGGNQTMEQLEQNHVTDFLSSIVEEYARFYDVRGRFAAIQYGDTAEVSLTFSMDIPYVTYSLRNLKNMNFSEGQPANMATGLNLANRIFEDNEKSKLVMVITDEVADAELTDDILTEVQYLNDRGINVNVVGIASNPADDQFFEEVAGSTGGAISVHKYEELKNEVNNVINAACQGHVIFRQNDRFSLTL